MIASAAERDMLARNLLFITTPAIWSTWPFLPLVRRTSGQEELGLLFDAMGTSSRTGYSATVFRGCLFMLPDTFEEFLNLEKEVFDTADELLEAGWRVD